MKRRKHFEVRLSTDVLSFLYRIRTDAGGTFYAWFVDMFDSLKRGHRQYDQRGPHRQVGRFGIEGFEYWGVEILGDRGWQFSYIESDKKKEKTLWVIWIKEIKRKEV